ncbi:hypothetical protein D9757_009366 [Collybiopsis confluens]|uniref:Fungal-type protein kinase domain-containing protein n=1 Tax=Collybiopsis confluens TaxID=2823264 RepID=A0A8H5H6P0_9AGAR|nr:hypothetical protein D9757_009366 [Collybiopsis confluens]
MSISTPKRKRNDGLPSTLLNNCAATHYPLPTATSNHVIFKEPHAEAAQEMAGRYEKVSIKQLLNLLPGGPKGMPRPNHKALLEVARILREPDMYDPFIKAMQPYVASGWQFVNTSSHLDISSGAAQFFGGSEIKPDMGLYSKARRNKPPTDASEAELFGEFKVKAADDPFPDPAKIAAEDEKALARDTRGQITLYINAIQATQHRTRVFFFFILGDQCRLFCHSRAGTQYTQLFKYTRTSHLHEFFWRLSHASPAARGHDATFIPVSSPNNRSGRRARQKLNLDREETLYQVTINEQKLYVARAFTRAHAYPIGRGTRCFAAYDPQSPHLVLLKDCWRYAKYDPEHAIYKQLHDSDVHHIPGVIVAGDVNGVFHKTKVNGYELIHYRLVLNIFGEPLTKAGSTYVFCKAISTALSGIILSQGQGYLIDWERAKSISKSGARTKDRTGTWEFLSIRLLQDSDNDDPQVVHAIRDDLESFVHVMMYCALRYAANGLTPKYRMFNLEDFEYTRRGPDVRKLMLILAGVGHFELSTQPFSDLLDRLVESLGHLYTKPQILAGRFRLRMDPAQVDAEVRKAQSLMLTHDWMKNTLGGALEDEGWKSINTDWGPNEVGNPHAGDNRATKKLKAGHGYSQDLSTQRDSLSLRDFE